MSHENHRNRGVAAGQRVDGRRLVRIAAALLLVFIANLAVSAAAIMVFEKVLL